VDVREAHRSAQLDAALLGLLNVRYLIAAYPLDAEGLQLLVHLDGSYVYRNERCLPRAFLVERAVPVEGWQEALSRLDKGYDPASGALVEGGPPLDGPPGWREAQVTYRSPNRIVVQANPRRPALLVLSEVWYPGWEVTVDGGREPLHRVYGVLRGVYLDPGTHVIAWRYRPRSLAWGGAITAATLVAWLGVCLPWRRRLRGAPWLAAGAIAALALLLYWPFVLGGKVMFWGTPLLQFWPWRTFAVESLRAGQLPLWNPYSGNGSPLLADHQSAVLYPLNVLYLLVPVERAMGLSLALHAVLAGAAMYALARELGVSRLGATVSALALMGSGYMVSRGAFLTEVSALPWLPLIWLYGRRATRRPTATSAARLAVVVALQFLAGHAQTWFYSLCSLALYALWEVGRAVLIRRTSVHAEPDCAAWRRALPHLGRVALIALAVAWGIALAAAQFLPTLELSVAAGRADREGWEAFALQYSFWPWRLITLLLPDFFGNPARGDYWGYATYWEDAGYIGVLPFFLALYAVVAWLRRRRSQAPGLLTETPFWALLSLFALLMAMGKNTPLYMFFFRYVPGFASFQAPTRWLCIYTPAMALLSGIGIDALRPFPHLTFACRLALAGSVALGATTVVAQHLLSGIEATFFGPLIQFAALSAASMILFLWGQRFRTPRPQPPDRAGWRDAGGLYPVAITLLIVIDLALAGASLNPAVDASLYEPQTAIGSFLAAEGSGRTFYFAEPLHEVMWERYLDFGDYGPADVRYWWGMREALLPDLGIAERVPSANSFEPLVEGRYHALTSAIKDLPRNQALRLLGMMNVAYLLDPAPDAGEMAYRSPSVYVYRNPYALPRAFVACAAVPARSAEEALALATMPNFDPARQVIVEARVAPSDRACTGWQATLLRSDPNQVTIRAVLPQPGYLVLTDTYYPGWRVFVDGNRAAVLRANVAFRATALSAGEHEVVFRYRPRSFAAGVACSLLAWTGVGIALWIGRRARYRRT